MIYIIKSICYISSLLGPRMIVSIDFRDRVMILLPISMCNKVFVIMDGAEEQKSPSTYSFLCHCFGDT